MSSGASLVFREEDRAALRDSAREALGDCSSAEQVRAQMATEQGWDRAVWRRLCTELGAAGLAVPEAFGGAGATLHEAGLLFEEAGATLLCAPLLATAAMSVPALLASGDGAACERWLPRLVSGEVVGALATADAAGRHPAREPVRATAADAGWRLDGTAGFVVDGAHADLLLVPAVTPHGEALFAVTDAEGVRREPLVTLDLTRRQAHLHLRGAPAELVGPLGAAARLAAAYDAARALLACEMVGGAARALTMTVAHAQQRYQFGRPIGSFQAVKQKCADMLIAVEQARSAALHAVSVADDERALASRVAHAFCAEAFGFVTAAAIQLHGGIGFTWEHEAHLHFKRAKASAVMLGTPAQHYDAIAERLA